MILAPVMNDRIHELMGRMQELEETLERELRAREQRLLDEISQRTAEVEARVRAAHRRLRMDLPRWLRESRPQNVLSAPLIYAMIVPLAFLDLCMTLYQALCFPLYGIPRVRRARYVVVDRHRLGYLNAPEKLNCAYCGYANGLLAYAREIAARTEQYWCPIKHARPVLGTHARYRRFLDYGSAEDYHAELTRLRDELAREQDGRP
jgi:hypothetical protein